MTHEIDFVVLWVDGNDLKWRKEKDKYKKEILNKSKEDGEERYRDWNLFHYWFRGVEKYAPWVRNVFLVTCGQTPQWININHPKLRLVNHEDFIDNRYLPTFNSSAIEINLHKIKDLGEYFVFFNDDMFLTRPVKPEDFFQDGEPLICSAGFPIHNFNNDVWDHMQFTIMGLANKYNWASIINKNPYKWFYYKYKDYLRYNWRMYKDSYMFGFFYVHFASPFRKTSLIKAENTFPEEFKQTSQSKFRSPYNISQQLIKICAIANGDFSPCSTDHFGIYRNIDEYHLPSIIASIKNQNEMMVCINDSCDITKQNFELFQNKISEALESILPEKSSFEI